MRSAPRIPIFARLRHDVWNLHLSDLRRPLQDVHRVTHTGVPGDVAVVWPHAGIVRVDLDDEVSVPAEHVRVPADRVGGIDQSATVPVAGSFS